MKYFNDYPTKKIGKSNPYMMCASCHNSAPHINGRIYNHEEFCEYRKTMELNGLLKEQITEDINKIENEIENLKMSEVNQHIMNCRLYDKEKLEEQLSLLDIAGVK